MNKNTPQAFTFAKSFKAKHQKISLLKNSLFLISFLMSGILLAACSSPSNVPTSEKNTTDAPSSKNSTSQTESSQAASSQAATSQAASSQTASSDISSLKDQPSKGSSSETAPNPANPVNDGSVSAQADDTQSNTTACDNSARPVTLTQGQFSQSAFLTGYNYCEYVLSVKAGQTVSAEVSGENLGLEVIVYSPEFHDFYSSDYEVKSDGDLTLRVLMTRNEARKHEHDAIPFNLNIAVKN